MSPGDDNGQEKAMTKCLKESMYAVYLQKAYMYIFWTLIKDKDKYPDKDRYPDKDKYPDKYKHPNKDQDKKQMFETPVVCYIVKIKVFNIKDIK